MKFLITLTIIFILLVHSTAFACGFKPFKPFKPYGCETQVAVCVCDSQGGNCRWQWVCY